MSSTTIGELVDFRGLCKIEKRFVQLLEEACSNHPTLIESQKKRNRTQKFIEWSFTALGRVMHFVNTKSAEDMNHDACNELENLWEELSAFGFDDLTWLERHVQSALSMKNHHLEVDDLQVDKMELAKGGTESLFKSLAMCFKSFHTSHTSLDPVLKLKGTEYQYVYEWFLPRSRHICLEMELDQFYDPRNGFLVNDTCIIVAEVLNVAELAFFKSRIENLTYR
ncbi:hypothetical protein PIB30_012423 [Stylosanthes scabra]|uniref:MATH domain-containing protein n=1 Tax=Stylosanthes scabra TaxID=79078 RepID=A0ABU6S6R6_9FABA|nr:hypothetical protein [Stylosanthes scabra]